MTVSITAVMSSELSSVGRAFGPERWQNERTRPAESNETNEDGHPRKHAETERTGAVEADHEMNHHSLHLLLSPCSCDQFIKQQIYFRLFICMCGALK